jgi:hypothetical protein
MQLFRREEFEHFNIHLDNNRTIFIPGQKVEGHLSLILNSPIKVHFIKVKFTGKVLTKAQQYEKVITNETSSITLFKDNTNVLGELGFTVHYISSGEHVFPFQFRMPSCLLPASFEGQFGNIRYSLDATIVKNNLSKTNTSILLTVPSTKNSNDFDLQDSMMLCKTIYPGFGFFKTSPFHVDVSIPRKGYSSGKCLLTKKRLHRFH